MADVKEVLLELPWNVVDKCNSFGMDFGGSVCKVIYLHNDDWIEPGKRTKETVSLRCVNISRTEFAQSLDYLKTRVRINRKHPGHKPCVNITGVGGVQFEKDIQDNFDVETKTLTEFDCHLAGMDFLLRNCNRGEIEYELDLDIVKKGVGRIHDQIKLLAGVLRESPKMDWPTIDPSSIVSPLEAPFEAEKKLLDYSNLFPYFLVTIGSGGGIFFVREDGTYCCAAEMKRAGRMFLGLASILTRSKSFAEIMSKAERGNMRSVHEYFSDLSVDPEEESIYGELGKHEDTAVGQTPAYLFGKAVFKELDEFTSEDLAKSFLYSTVCDMIQIIHSALRVFPQVKHVFFAGGFPNHPLTRDCIVDEWLERDGHGVTLFNQTEFANVHFLKHGSHLAALGTFLRPHLKFTDVYDEQ